MIRLGSSPAVPEVGSSVPEVVCPEVVCLAHFFLTHPPYGGRFSPACVAFLGTAAGNVSFGLVVTSPPSYTPSLHPPYGGLLRYHGCSDSQTTLLIAWVSLLHVIEPSNSSVSNHPLSPLGMGLVLSTQGLRTSSRTDGTRTLHGP